MRYGTGGKGYSVPDGFSAHGDPNAASRESLGQIHLPPNTRWTLSEPDDQSDASYPSRSVSELASMAALSAPSQSGCQINLAVSAIRPLKQ